MFIVCEIKNDIRVSPENRRNDFKKVLENEINRMYANKVVMDLGLIIALYEIIQIADSYVVPVDGTSVTPVHFSVIVFRPSPSTLLTGRIKNCSNDGIQLTLGFFDDIFIPAKNLQYPSRFDQSEQCWIWEYQLEDGSKHDLILDTGESVQFRVVSETFSESAPVPVDSVLGSVKPVPYSITASINQPGLGAISWWTDQD